MANNKINSPTPGIEIVQKTGTKSYRDMYSPGVEIDAMSAKSYNDLKSEFPGAWDSYFGGTSGAPGYTPENALKLQEAVRFWEYMNVGEIVTQLVPTDTGEVDEVTEEPIMRQGTIEEPKAFAGNTIADARYPYFKEGALLRPEAFYDPEAYASTTTTSNDDLAGVDTVLASTGVNSDRTLGSDPLNIFSPGYENLTEYNTTRRVAETPYEWGSEYSVGRNRLPQ